MTDYAVKVDNVTKTFKLPLEKSNSLKSSFINLLRTKRGYELQKAVDDVSLQVNKGEFFGIVGRNGSGKSTLLKMLAGIYSPTKGTIELNGSLTPFIELGVGFNPELTGRENIFLNGALLGFSRKEMQVMYSDIVKFSELEKFMDQKLKNYSSGMQVRLAFSIAIRSQSDILLIDEVLAVGDEEFQKKCLSIFEKYKADNRTVILVTHDMAVVEKYCDRAVLVDSGKIIQEGEPRRIAHQYSKMNTDRYITYKENQQDGSLQRRLLDKWDMKVSLHDSKGKAVSSFKHGETAIIKMRWQGNKIKNVGIALQRQSGEYVFGANTILDNYNIKGNHLEYKIQLNLGDGDYEFKLGLFGEKEDEVLEFIDGPKLFLDIPRYQIKWGGVTKLEHSWE
jgi:ABC-2 type transport system ATP-binding protein